MFDFNSGKQSVVDDFMYGSSVASAHVYIRLNFLRKVYGILSVQLLLTTIVGALCMLVEPVKMYLQSSSVLLTLSAIASFGFLIALHVYSREVPMNYILLGLFTLCESVLVGTAVTFYDVQVVVEAFALTCAVTVALTVYTLQSKRDYSSWGAGLFAILYVLILAMLMQIVFQSAMMDRLISVAGAAIFCLFIVFDTHMIMNRVSPEDYMIATINLYLDILNLFLHILRIMAESRRK